MQLKMKGVCDCSYKFNFKEYSGQEDNKYPQDIKRGKNDFKNTS